MSSTDEKGSIHTNRSKSIDTKKSKSIHGDESKIIDAHQTEIGGTRQTKSEDPHQTKTEDTPPTKGEDGHQTKSVSFHQTKSEAKQPTKIEETHQTKSEDKLQTKSEETHLTKSGDKLQTKSEETHQTKGGDKLQTKSEETHQTKSGDKLQTKSEETHQTKSGDKLQTKNEETHQTKSGDKLQTKNEETHQTKSGDELKTKIEETNETDSKDIHQSKIIDNDEAKNGDTQKNQSVDAHLIETGEKIQTSSGHTLKTQTGDTITSEIIGTEEAKSGDSHKTQSIDAHLTETDETIQTRSRDTLQSKSVTLHSKSILLQSKSSDTILIQKKKAEPKKICVIGSGNWGTVIAKVIGTNITKLESYSNEVTLYVQEEIVNGKRLSDIINETHENIKNLPGHQIPDNVIAIPDVVEAAKEAHIIIFTLQQEYITSVCKALVGKIKPTAAGLCLTKGFTLSDDGNIDLFSQIITRHLKIQTSVLMGANLCEEIANEQYCEATIGCKDKLLAAILKELIQTEYLRITVVDDVDGVEVCGSLRNVIACGVGFLDGWDMGRCAKATIIRLGLIEMIKFVDLFYPGSKISTFFESCGVADLATCYLAGRNRGISEKFVTTKKSITEFENEMLGGHTLEGPSTAKLVHTVLKERDIEYKFPLFTAINKVYAGDLDPSNFFDSVLNNSEHINVRLLHLTW